MNGCWGGRVVAQADWWKKREEIAYSFLDSNLERAKLLHQALDRKAKPPEGLDLYLFTGDLPFWDNT